MATQEYARRNRTRGAQAAAGGPVGGAGRQTVTVKTNRAQHRAIQAVKGVRYLATRKVPTPPPQGNGR